MEQTISYLKLLNDIQMGLICTDKLWVRDDHGTTWFWTEFGLATGMKEWDKEPPLIYITDRYSTVDLYSLTFTILSLTKDTKPEILNAFEIFSKYRDYKKPVKLIDTKTNKEWEFVPLKSSIINSSGANLLDIISASELPTTLFEVYPYLDKNKKKKKKSKYDILKESIKELTVRVSNIEEELEELNAYVQHIESLMES